MNLQDCKNEANINDQALTILRTGKLKKCSSIHSEQLSSRLSAGHCWHLQQALVKCRIRSISGLIYIKSTKLPIYGTPK